MRRHSITVLLAGALFLAGCSTSTGGQPAAGAATSESSATPSSSEAGAADGTAASAGAEPGVAVDAAVVETSVMRPMQVESDDFWEEILGLTGSKAKVSAAMVFLPGRETVDCGGVTLSGPDQFGPTYCASSDRIVVSETFMTNLGASAVLRTDGSFADPAAEVGVYFLLAHQWGHNVIDELVAAAGADVTFVLGNHTELAADCFAGLAIAGVPRVFTDKDPASVLSQVVLVGERFSGIAGSPAPRVKAVAFGMAKDYDDRPGLAAGVNECLTEHAPTLAKALGAS